MEDIEATLIINPLEEINKLKALASEPRVQMLNLIRKKTLNINEISESLKLPQSTVATHISILEEAGLICSGTSPDGNLVEIVEYKNHPFFIAGQFHPEFKSRPDRPAPLFKAFIKAAKESRK